MLQNGLRKLWGRSNVWCGSIRKHHAYHLRMDFLTVQRRAAVASTHAQSVKFTFFVRIIFDLSSMKCEATFQDPTLYDWEWFISIQFIAEFNNCLPVTSKWRIRYNTMQSFNGERMLANYNIFCIFVEDLFSHWISVFFKKNFWQKYKLKWIFAGRRIQFQRFHKFHFP